MRCAVLSTLFVLVRIARRLLLGAFGAGSGMIGHGAVAGQWLDARG